MQSGLKCICGAKCREQRAQDISSAARADEFKRLFGGQRGLEQSLENVRVFRDLYRRR